jgi:amino acid adenylation domain-containing protein
VVFESISQVRARITAEAELLEWLRQLQADHCELCQCDGLPVCIRASLDDATSDPLTVLAVPGERLLLRMSYDVGRFDAATIERMLGHFQTVLEAMAARPRQRLGEIPLLTAAESRQLREWNDTTGAYSLERCLHELFETQATEQPAATAVDCEGRQLAYGELNRRANQMAHHLQRLGVGPEVIVGICAERSLEMVVALLGIWKAGGAYLPLDPEYPRARIAYMLADARVDIVVVQPHLAAVVEACGGGRRLVQLDSSWELTAGEAADNPSSGVTPDNLSYVIYTSGSTGQPKGVMIEHRAICNNLLWIQQIWKLDGRDRVLQKTSFSFDVSVKEFFWPLIAGARLVLARPGGHRDPAYLRRVIAEQGITVVHFVPSMLRLFLAEPGLETCASLRLVMCGAEALPWELQERFFALLPADLFHLYGPTEAAISVTGWVCERNSRREMVPLGRAMSNVQIYILDGHRNPLPVGVAGEVYIGGVALARGYLHRAAETVEKFVPNHFSEAGGARLYKSGDRARYLADGNLEFLGRMDQQVKVRGFRIELGEIESVLLECAGVESAVAVVQDVGEGNRKIVAYVVAPGVTARQLRSHAAEKLPGHMVPAAFVPLEKLPLMPNGKVDRQALPRADFSRPELGGEYAGPRTAVEEQVAAIWAQVLKLDRVGIHDNFFELGGDSLMAMQVISRVRNRFAEDLPLRSIFEAPTVAGLVETLELAMWARQGAKARHAAMGWEAGSV